MSKNDAYMISMQAGLVPVGVGEPGIGKTQTILAFGRAAGRPVHVILGSVREPADVAGYPCLVDGVMRLAPPSWASDANHDPSIILFDEINNAAPATQSAELRVMSEWVVGETPLRRDTWICGAMNPSGMAANGHDLEPPLANRLVHLQWHIDWESWESGLMRGLDFPNPEFPLLPHDWQKHIPGMAGIVAAFRRKRPTLFQEFPKDRSKTSGAWPSMRSWTNGLIGMAACESIGASEAVSSEILTGCVGDGAALEFSEWRNSLDLPDAGEVLEWAKSCEAGKPKKFPGTRETEYRHPDRPDKAMAMLSSVTAIALRGASKEDWEAGIFVMESASKFAMDMAISFAAQLAKNPAKGAKLNAGFVAKIMPTIKKLV